VEAEQGKLETALLELLASSYQVWQTGSNRSAMVNAATHSPWFYESQTSAPMVESSNNAIIRIFHAHKRYGSKFALHDVSLDIIKNEYLFVTGASGAGKTTLLKLLYLGETASEGQILVDGMNISRINRKSIPLLRRKLGIIFQDYKLISTKTVYENVALVLEAAGRKPRLIEKKVRSVLRTVGMEDRMKSFPPSLSGGEQQRVAVARAVVGDPKIILADEPTGSLDAESAGVIMAFLDDFHSRGATVIIATHDKQLIRKEGTRVVHLREGRLLSNSSI
jgi:cell division transport system ATP-binding protein